MAVERLKVTLQDGVELELAILPIDVVMVERKYKVSVPEKGEDLAFECQAYMVYQAWRRSPEASAKVSYDAFLTDYLADIDEVPDVPLEEPSGS